LTELSEIDPEDIISLKDNSANIPKKRKILLNFSIEININMKALIHENMGKISNYTFTVKIRSNTNAFPFTLKDNIWKDLTN